MFLAVSRVFRGIMGCSRGVPGLFQAVPSCSGGVPGMFRAVPGCSRGVPGCFGVFRCVPGFTDTRLLTILKYFLISHSTLLYYTWLIR